MGVERYELLPRRSVPEFERSLFAAAGERFAAGRKRHGLDFAGVSSERGLFKAGRDAPNPDRAVVAGGRQRRPVG